MSKPSVNYAIQPVALAVRAQGQLQQSSSLALMLFHTGCKRSPAEGAGPLSLRRAAFILIHSDVVLA